MFWDHWRLAKFKIHIIEDIEEGRQIDEIKCMFKTLIQGTFHEIKRLDSTYWKNIWGPGKINTEQSRYILIICAIFISNRGMFLNFTPKKLMPEILVHLQNKDRHSMNVSLSVYLIENIGNLVSLYVL